MKTKLRLTLVVEYESNGTDVKTLKDYIENAVDFAYDKGLLTRESPAEIEDWAYTVEELK